MRRLLHRLAHLLGWHGCTVQEIRHQPGCTRQGLERNCCDWVVVLRCTTCDRTKEIA